MNRSDLQAMRQRLADRSAADAEDHPAMIALAAFLMGFAVLAFAFV